MPNDKLGKWQKEGAKIYYLAHLDASISDVAKALDIAPRSAARARAELVKEGLIGVGRKADAPPMTKNDVQKVILAKVEAAKVEKVNVLDTKAMEEMAGMLDEASEDQDDEVTRKRMLAAIKRIAFNPALHPDTRMSATTVWLKLKEMAKSRDLGPGKPMNAVTAIARLVNIFRAVGPDLAMKAMYIAFDVKEPTDEGKLSADPTKDAQSSSGTAGPSGNAPEIQSDGEK